MMRIRYDIPSWEIFIETMISAQLEASRGSAMAIS
jgi:hypothetical protein